MNRALKAIGVEISPPGPAGSDDVEHLKHARVDSNCLTYASPNPAVTFGPINPRVTQAPRGQSPGVAVANDSEGKNFASRYPGLNAQTRIAVVTVSWAFTSAFPPKFDDQTKTAVKTTAPRRKLRRGRNPRWSTNLESGNFRLETGVATTSKPGLR